jgi:hypothetical protein
MVSSTFTWPRLAAALAIAAASALPALAKYNNGFDPDPREVARLPKFCQGQYVPSLAKQPGYNIEGCGASNHFCPSLVLLNRAEDFTLSKQVRQYAMQQAGDNLAYTRGHMTPQTCWLWPHQSAAEARFKLLKIMLK